MLLSQFDFDLIFHLFFSTFLIDTLFDKTHAWATIGWIQKKTSKKRSVSKEVKRIRENAVVIRDLLVLVHAFSTFRGTNKFNKQDRFRLSVMLFLSVNGKCNSVLDVPLTVIYMNNDNGNGNGNNKMSTHNMTIIISATAYLHRIYSHTLCKSTTHRQNINTKMVRQYRSKPNA